jgi:hypothetical protein
MSNETSRTVQSGHTATTAQNIRSRTSLTLERDERVELTRLLESALRDTHVEARRTEAPDFQDEVHERERILRGLLGKLRGL